MRRALENRQAVCTSAPHWAHRLGAHVTTIDLNPSRVAGVAELLPLVGLEGAYHKMRATSFTCAWGWG
jgi:hypothetical protein